MGGNGHTHERGSNGSAAIAALVFSLRESQELAQELVDLSALVGCLESIHGRAIVPSEQIDEFCGANFDDMDAKGENTLEPSPRPGQGTLN